MKEIQNLENDCEGLCNYSKGIGFIQTTKNCKEAYAQKSTPQETKKWPFTNLFGPSNKKKQEELTIEGGQKRKRTKRKKYKLQKTQRKKSKKNKTKRKMK